MLKIQQIRDLLTSNIDYIKMNPESLLTFVSKGNIIAAPAKSASFEYQFTAEIIIIDYAEHPDTVIVPLIIWLMENQSERFANPDRRKDALKFELEYLDHDKFDLFITLELTERVLVKSKEDGIHAEHIPEPKFDTEATNGWQIQLNGESIITHNM